ncbi:MAG: aldo/keto reductase [Phycisphaeraceae bacterium]|nr:aldo/keto reductase [Phycisphaeraceae bacterium]
MKSKIRWGILSTGQIASTFAKAVARSEHGTLAAVASRDVEKARQFAEKFGQGDVEALGSYEELLASDAVDAVYIATPHPLHARWTILAIEAGKHVLCEKPLALNHAQVMAMVNKARERKVFLMEGFMYRCHPQTAKVVELIQKGAIGEVRMIQGSFGFNAGFNPESRLFANALGGGGILDVGCYPVSYARLIAGAAMGRPFADPVSVSAEGKLTETGVDGWAAAALRFENGIVAQVATGVQCQLDSALRIFGSTGSLVIAKPWVHGRDAGDTTTIEIHRRGQETETVTTETQVPAFTYEADLVAQAILAGKTEAPAPAMSLDDSLGNAMTLDQWRQKIGVIYEAEKPENLTETLTGRPLARRKDAAMPYGRIDGLEKEVARLVMGVDNQTEISHATAMFDDYFERGGNAFDTAFVYRGGLCEKVLGQWIANRGIRDQIVVLGKGAHTPHCDPDSLTSQLMTSLERLGLEHLDIYMMHRDNEAIPVGEFMDVLNAHHAAGRIRAFGGSNWSVKRIEEANQYAASKGLRPMTAASNNFSLARMVQPVWAGCVAASDDDQRQWFEKNKLPLMPWSSQARGFFTDRAGPDKREDASLVRCWYSDDNFKRRQRAVELAAKKGCDAIHIALAYVLSQPFPTFPLIGPRTIEETRSSFRGLTVELTPKEVAWLDLRD